MPWLFKLKKGNGMKIQLEELCHQSEALQAIDSAFYGLDINSDDPDANYVYANPLIRGRYTDAANIDVKMETGTGKTYVGVRTMFELHRKYGLFKFIVVVPTPAIKEGWKNFIQADYVKQHFSQFYENTKVNLNVINSGDFNSKKDLMPANLVDFIESDRLNSNTIQILLINADMLRSTNMQGIKKVKGVVRDRFNQTLLSGFTKPLEGLQANRPVVLVDEPHRFPKTGKYYEAIQSVKPQMIIRFGATFNKETKGRGTNKVEVYDYYRNKPQFNLNAVDSFNQGLVKGIDIYYPELTTEQANNRYKVAKVTAKELVLKQGSTEYALSLDDNLANVDPAFQGDVTFVGTSDKLLSNDLELAVGMELVPGTFEASYQEMLIQSAIDKHFEAEIRNFMRVNLVEHNAPRIKTISLFFIDSIRSYRDDDGWLKETFERLLKDKLNKLIREYQRKTLERETQYLDYLQATLQSLVSDTQYVHAGYFGEDRGSGDEAIQAEIEDILSNKEKMLSFKSEDGSWNTRRFLFSKWTLREGWDNPNVFVIAKLRTSGSETSKIQEVGRGLRLPVDETGHRVQQDEFESRLAYLIGYDEKDFADLLIGEVNGDADVKLDEKKLTDNMISLIVEDRKRTDETFDRKKLLNELDAKGIIDRDNEFEPKVEIDGDVKSGFEWTMVLYPALSQQKVRPGKIKNRPKNSATAKVKLRKENWEQLKSVWRRFSQRYMLEFERRPGAISMIVDDVFGNVDLYQREKPEMTHIRIEGNEDSSEVLARSNTAEMKVSYRDGMPYGKFLKQLALRTRLPIQELHKAVALTLSNKLGSDQRYLTETTLVNLNREFKARFENAYAQSYKYEPLDFQATTSVFDPNTDEFVDEISADAIGREVDDSVLTDKDSFLYDTPPMRYDSVTPERDLLKRDYDDEVTVFGKLPKRAIQVPKYTGGTTTPDFVYMVEREDKSHVYLLVETKADNKRISDQQIVDIQTEFFRQLDQQNVVYTEATDAQTVISKLRTLENEKGGN